LGEIEVHGRGIVAQAAALAAADLGLRVRALKPSKVTHAHDVRAFAITPPSEHLLRELAAWPHAHACPVLRMEVHADPLADGKHAAPLVFSNADGGTLAHIVPAPALELRLAERLNEVAGSSARIVLVDSLTTPALAPSRLHLVADAQLKAQLQVDVQKDAYPQTAVATLVAMDAPHGGCARQWMAAAGDAPDTLALLPVQGDTPGDDGNLCAVVWSVHHDHARAICAMNAADVAATLSQRCGLVVREVVGPVQSWPLQKHVAQAWTGPNWLLLGDVAHGVHPLAGLGLNLGLADVSVWRDVWRARSPGVGQEAWRAVTDAKLLARYERRALTHASEILGATDGLFQLFSRPQPLAVNLRQWGFSVVDRIEPLKHWLAQRAAGR
jgi:2-polyprenyl-6-methoxyphenol hydroxylase-like FAD-dependent oxidoreductase